MQVSGHGHAVAGRDLIVVQLLPLGLTPEENDLLHAYRTTTTDGRKHLLSVASGLPKIMMNKRCEA